MRSRAAGFSLLCGLGCSSPGDYLAWPELPADTESAFVFVSPPSASSSLELYDLSVDGLPALEIDLGEDSRPTRVAVLTHRVGPEDLGVTPGPVPFAGSGECLSVPLLAAADGFELELEPEALGEWQPLASPRPPWISSASYRTPCPCGDWQFLEELTFQAQGWVVLAGDDVFVFPILSRASASRFNLEGHTLIEVAGSSGRSYFGAAATADGRVFAAASSTTAGGYEVLEFDVAGRMLPLPPVPLRGDVPDALLTGEGETLELYLMTDSGRLLAFDDSAGWTVLQDETLVIAGGGGRQQRSMAWIGPGEVAAAVHNSSAIIHTRPGLVPVVYVPPLSEFVSAVRVLGWSEGLGLVAGNLAGRLAKVESSEVWTLLPHAELGRLSGVLAHQDSLLVAADRGWTELHPEAGLCPATQPSGGSLFYGGLLRWREFVIGWSANTTEVTTVLRLYRR